jgi:hypothetical protein
MRSLATKQPINDVVKQKHGGRGRSHSISPLSTGMPLLQRQCACGGGCPRCQDELGIQTKLKISEPGDRYEQEADRIADEVMRMPEPQRSPNHPNLPQIKQTVQPISLLQRFDFPWPFNGYVINNSSEPVTVWNSARGDDETGIYSIPAYSTSERYSEDVDHIQDRWGHWYKIGANTVTVDANGDVNGYECEVRRWGDGCNSLERPNAELDAGVPHDAGVPLPGGVLNRKINRATNIVGNADRSTEVPSIVHEVLNSPGQPLDPETLTFMESRFGQDFNHVQIHTNTKAEVSAHSVNAKAYTVANHIVFGQGQYSPTTQEGQRLLAHELTHVLQNEKQLVQKKPENKRPNVSSIISTVTTAQNDSLQRVVRVSARDAQLQITSEPQVSLTVQSLLNRWRVRPTTTQWIEFAANAQAICDPGDSPAGYEIGLVQVETREVNNAYYRGTTPSDGSVWVRRDIPSVRPIGPCIDSAYQGFWHNPQLIACNSRSSLTHRDAPQDMYDTILTNSQTGRQNYLKELHIAFDFTTALMLKMPNNTLQTLRWLRWDIGWDYQFTTPASGESRINAGSISRYGTLQLIDAVSPPPELPTVYAIPARNCNTLSYEAGQNPARIQPSNQW